MTSSTGAPGRRSRCCGLLPLVVVGSDRRNQAWRLWSLPELHTSVCVSPTTASVFLSRKLHQQGASSFILEALPLPLGLRMVFE